MVIESTLWVLSIQQKFQFESLEIPNGTCNGTFGTFWLLFLQAGYKRAEQFCHNIMERDISVWPTKMTWPIKVDYLHNRGHHLFLSPGWQLWSPLLKMAGKLSTPPPPPFFSRGYLKDCGKLTKWNIHSKMGCHYLWPCWFACAAMDYWLKQHNMGWQYLKQVRCRKGEKKWNNKHGEML